MEAAYRIKRAARRYWQVGAALGVGVVVALGGTAVFSANQLGAVVGGIGDVESEGGKITQEFYDSQGRFAERAVVESATQPSGRHTLEFKIGGTNMQGIEIAGMDLKAEDPDNPKDVVSIDAGSKSIFADKLILRRVHAAQLKIEDSEVLELSVEGVRADGASTHVEVAEAPITRRGFRGYNSLPVWQVDAARYDIVEIEADGVDAHVGYILLEDLNVPGTLSIKDLKVNELIIEDSTFGRGDGLEEKDFVFDDVLVEQVSLEDVVEAPVDNLLAPLLGGE